MSLQIVFNEDRPWKNMGTRPHPDASKEKKLKGTPEAWQPPDKTYDELQADASYTKNRLISEIVTSIMDQTNAVMMLSKAVHLSGNSSNGNSKTDRDRASVNDRLTKNMFIFRPVKDVERIKVKAHVQYRDDFSRITDYEGGMIKCNTVDQVAATCSFLEYAKQWGFELPHGAEVITFENKFLAPTSSGYSAGQAKIAVPLPGGEWHVFELMLAHNDFEEDIKQAQNTRHGNKNSHQLYEAARWMKLRIKELGQHIADIQNDGNPYRKEELNNLTKQMQDSIAQRKSMLTRLKKIHNEAKVKHGLTPSEIPFSKYERILEEIIDAQFTNEKEPALEIDQSLS